MKNIFKKMKNSKHEEGVALLLVILLMTITLSLAIYFMNFSLTESTISKSYTSNNSTYYLSEAAVNEVIWKLQNDPDWKNNFTGSSTWSTTLTRNNPMGVNGSYTVSVKNTGLAHATVFATSTITLPNNRTSQRVVSVNLYRATGLSALGGNVAISDGTLNISGSEVNINGTIHSNANIEIANGSEVHFSSSTASSSVSAVGTVNVSNNSQVETTYIYGTNTVLGGASSSTVPAVDFNSSSTNSMKSMADHVYAAAAFNESMLANPGLIYVIGSVNLTNTNDTFTHKGALVVEGDLTLNFKRWDISTSSQNTPVGLFASGNLTLKSPNGGQEGIIYGVIYAGNKLSLQLKPMGNSHDVIISGGIAGKTIDIYNAGTGNGQVQFLINPDLVNQSLVNTSQSPVITTDHWEEEY